MNKRAKRIHAARMLRLAIDDSMNRHPYYKYEYCDYSSDCDDCERCLCAPFMVSFYDHDRNHLVSNWLNNSYCGPSCSYSSLIEDLSDYFDIDINHLMWNGADFLLHKVRYIRIGIRNLIEDENGYHYYIETGIEYDIHGKGVKHYRSKWYCGEPELNEQYNAGIGIA